MNYSMSRIETFASSWCARYFCCDMPVEYDLQYIFFRISKLAVPATVHIPELDNYARPSIYQYCIVFFFHSLFAGVYYYCTCFRCSDDIYCTIICGFSGSEDKDIHVAW